MESLDLPALCFASVVEIRESDTGNPQENELILANSSKADTAPEGGWVWLACYPAPTVSSRVDRKWGGAM